jgi:DNA-binding transcriptional LysR family regulator
MEMLDFRILTFLAVCGTMNYTRAAEELHITQPAVSQHIRALEETYGTALFRSEGKRLHLTEAGELLRRTAAAMHNDEQVLRDRLRTGGGQEPPLHFGVTMTIGEFLIARPLSAYLARRPEAEVRMEMRNTEDLLEQLRRGELQFALVEGYFDREEFDSAVYRTEPFLAVCAARRRFAPPAGGSAGPAGPAGAGPGARLRHPGHPGKAPGGPESVPAGFCRSRAGGRHAADFAASGAGRGHLLSL